MILLPGAHGAPALPVTKQSVPATSMAAIYWITAMRYPLVVGAGFVAVWGSCSSSASNGRPDARVGAVCDPAPLGPHWIDEGEPLSLSLVCMSGLELSGDRFVIEELPAGASYDPGSGTLTWTPGLDQAAYYRLGLSATPDNGDDGPSELRILSIGVADRWDHPDNVPIADPVSYPYEYGLPVFFLEPAPESEDYTSTTVYYGGRRYDIEAKLRGASSLDYPKRSYLLRFGQGLRFSDPAQAGGFTGKDRVVLTSTFDDNSYIRQRLSYELWNRLEPIIKVQAYSAVVYLGGEYFGLYTVSDFINDDLVEASGLAGSGNLYKAVNHDANFRLTNNRGGSKTTLHDGYEKTDGQPEQGQPGAFADMDELVSFVAQSSDSEFGSGIGERIAVNEYVSWWLLATFLTASDSAGKNSYHYHDPGDPEGLWRVAPWDFNHSLGQAWTTHRVAAGDIETYANRNYLFERLGADATHGPAMRARYGEELGTGVFTVESVLDTIDGYIADIDRSARRDWAKWEPTYRSYGRWSDRTDFTSFDQEVMYVRTWITEHAAFLAAQFP